MTLGAHLTRPARRAGTLVVFGILVLGAIGHVARLPTVAWDTMYAEDGFTFLREALTGSWTWVTPYDGYQHLIPRIAGSLIAHLLPVSWWANAMIVATGLVVGGISALAYVVALDLARSRVVAVAAAAFPVLVPVAGIEGIGNISNVHSFMPYAVLAALLARPRSRVALGIVALLIVIFVMTDIQTLLLLPVGLLLLWVRRGRFGVQFGAYVLALAVQLVSYLSVGRGGGPMAPTAVEVARGYLFNGVLGSVLGRVGVDRQIVSLVGWWPLGLAFIVWMGLIVVLLRRSPLVLAATLLVLAASVVSWSLAHVYLNYAALNFLTGPFKLARWGTAPALLLLATVLPVVWAGLSRGGRTRVVARAGVLTLLVAQCVSLVLPTSRFGVHWSEELEPARQVCGTGSDSVTVPILPSDAVFELPCSVFD